MVDEVVVKMGQVWASISDLCEAFTEDDWARPTDCPGWSVKDQLSHLVGPEARFLGRPEPEHTPADMSHVRNPAGAANEVAVDYRRPCGGSEVLAEFREVTGERLKLLEAMSDEDLAGESWTPTGPATVRDLVAIRVYDAWVHEQDMRRAVGLPGHLDGPVAEHSRDRTIGAMPFVVGKKVQPQDGTTVVFDVIGPAGQAFSIGVDGGRASLLASVPERPTASLRMDLETFICLGCGRWDSTQAFDDGRVQIEGDVALGRAVVEQMAFMI